MSDERKRFDCPSCGRDSWLDPKTLQVEHSEPTCEAWQAKQAAAAAPAVGGVVVPFPTPEVVNFDCPECKAPARMHPNEKPIPVEHSLPHCAAWEKIAGKKDDVERYLIKAGVHIHVPNRA